MSMSGVRRQGIWLLPLVGAVLVAVAGAWLITLSVRERSDQLRQLAQTTALRHADQIEGELVALSAAAQRAAHGARTGPGSDTRTPAQGRGTFWMDADGAVLGAPSADTGAAQAVAAEWAAVPSERRAAAGLLGPVRFGSRWIVAARAPASPPDADTAAAGEDAASTNGAHASGTPAAWAVSYADLESLLAHARFGTLVGEGYDFQLSQPDPQTHHGRVFLTSQPGTLAFPALGTIGPPEASSAGTAPFLTLAIRPRGGWYPARELAAEVGLLALLVWAVAFGTYDVIHSLRRTRSALASTRLRLHHANERLVGEIEQRQSLQKSFEHARYHDVFTGLPNRRYFMDQLDRALREIRTRRRQRVGIALIDIERLRLISDTLGHTAGDELLLQAAQRCTQALGAAEHVLARWGVDQLAVLYEVGSAAHAQQLADCLQEECQRPYELRQHRLSVTCRVGFTCTESGMQRVEEVLREADLAMSSAAQQHSVRARAYAPGMAGAAVSLVSLEADLHVALDRREFHLLYQPIVDLHAGRVVGAEALLRWRHPVEGLLTPDKFLAIAEESGVMVPVTRWIIQRVCRLGAEWRRRLPEARDFYISVNLSGAALRSPGLREYIANVLADTHLPAAHLKFELSEGGLVSNVTTARALLDGFHDMGIQLMLDDFGTGYSSLSYLQLFPFDYVKIDRPFVSRTGSERANNAITSAILQVTSNLGLQAVGEVVETRAAAETLVQMGCSFAQGYFFSPPVDAEVVFQQLRSTARLAVHEAGGESEVPELEEADDDSPTIMLPAGMILESRIHDDADESPEPSAASSRQA